MPEISREMPRNPGIDVLRGLSIVLVVMHHVGLRIPLRHGVLATFLPEWFLSALIYNGYEAVFIFFVISGFLITSNSLQRWGSLGAIHAPAFYTRRAARIVPCLVTLVAVLSVLHLVGARDYLIIRANQSLPRAVLSAFGLHLNWYEGYTGYLPGGWDVLWSLSIEEVFYLAFPIVCLLLRRRWTLVPALISLSISLPISRAAIVGNPIWQEKAYLPGIAAIATGVLGAIVAVSYRPRRRALLYSFAVAGILGLVSVLCFESWLWQRLGNGSMLVLTVSSLCLLLFFRWNEEADFAPWLLVSTEWLRSFGRLSYEVYLSHMFVVMGLVRVFKQSHAAIWWGILWYPPALAASWLLGWLVARYLSNPAQHFVVSALASGKSKSQRIGTELAPATTAASPSE